MTTEELQLVQRLRELQTGKFPGRIFPVDDRSRVVGTITDPRSSPVRGARLWLLHSRHEGISREDGGFEIPGVPMGSIDLVIEHERFNPLVLNDIQVSEGQIDLGTVVLTSARE
jgi:hypothetical protein